MKTIKSLLLVSLLGILTLSSCKINRGERIPDISSSKIDTVSYALGVWFGGSIKSADFGELDICHIKKGVNDMIKGKELKLSEQEVMNIISMHLMERGEYFANKSMKEGADFLAANKDKEGVVTAESGLQYKILEEGGGITPTALDTVEVNYRGTFINGEEFDSSYQRGEAIKFPVNGVIRGWSEGVQYIKEGGKIILYIPSNLAYGSQPNGPIPGNSTLIFEIELIKVFKGPESDNEFTND